MTRFKERMPEMKRLLLIAVLMFAGAAFAEGDLPFWGPETSNATNVVPTAFASAAVTVETRAFTWFFSEGIDFSSCPVGFMLLFR